MGGQSFTKPATWDKNRAVNPDFQMFSNAFYGLA